MDVGSVDLNQHCPKALSGEMNIEMLQSRRRARKFCDGELERGKVVEKALLDN